MAFARARLLSKGLQWDPGTLRERFLLEYEAKERVTKFLETLLICGSILSLKNDKVNLKDLLDQYIESLLPEEAGRKESFVEKALHTMSKFNKPLKIVPTEHGVAVKDMG